MSLYQKNLLGHKVGENGIVLECLGQRKHHTYYWLVKCGCGKLFETSTSKISGCETEKPIQGCVQCAAIRRGRQQRIKNIGLKFNYLLILDIEENYNNKGKKYICLCDCGNIKSVDIDKMRKGHTKSCGCLFKNKMIGETHPRWKHELTEEERLKQRGYKEYLDFRDYVYKRDNYTCQLTGLKGHLNVHHLNSYDWHIEGRCDPNNAVTLLKKVHKQFHDIYGRGNNTKQQFIEFKESFLCQ